MLQEERYARVSLEESKDYWFRGDLTIYLHKANNLTPILALPKAEVISSIQFVDRLKACTNYGEYSILYEEFRSDSGSPRFLPQLFSPYVLEDLRKKLVCKFLGVESVSAEEEDAFYKEISSWEESQRWNDPTEENEHPFSYFRYDADLTQFPYKWIPSETDSFQGLAHWIQWTSAWMPIEITEVTGFLSSQYHDHEGGPVYYYSGLDDFVAVWKKHGFKVEIDSPEMLVFSELVSEIFDED